MKVLGGKSSRVENALSAAGLPTSTKVSSYRASAVRMQSTAPKIEWLYSG